MLRWLWLLRDSSLLSVEQDSSQPPPSPSRSQLRWSPPPPSVVSRSPRKRLTWCAGDAEPTMRARGGGILTREAESPSSRSLNGGVCGGGAGNCEGTWAESRASPRSRRQRAATDPAGGMWDDSLARRDAAQREAGGFLPGLGAEVCKDSHER